MLWDDIHTAARRHMQNAFQIRRRRIASECKQVKADVDYYNGTHREEPPTQMVLDFRRDVEEMEIAEAAMRPSSSELSRQAEQSRVGVPETISLL
jgi:hypothetical protein